MIKKADKKEHICSICGYKWKGKKEVIACPRCKRYDWNKKRGEENGVPSKQRKYKRRTIF